MYMIAVVCTATIGCVNIGEVDGGLRFPRSQYARDPDHQWHAEETEHHPLL